MPELVTAISSVPPGAFNPTEGIEQVPLSCWCTRVVAEGKKAFHFWEKCHGGTVKDGVALAGESVTWHKSQDNAQECYHAGKIGDGSRARDRGEILGEEPPDEPTCNQDENSLLEYQCQEDGGSKENPASVAVQGVGRLTAVEDPDGNQVH